MSVQGIGGSQNVNSSSSANLYGDMSIDLVLTLAAFNRMDANDSRLRQTAVEMDVRTKKLEQLGKSSQALGGITNKFDKTEATQAVKDTPAGKNFTSDDWKNLEKDMKAIVIDGNTDYVPTPVAGGKDIKADQKGEAQTMKDNMIELARIGKESGLMTDSDISRLSKGEFKKSEIESLQASIKTEQDKIGNENSKQQLTLQSLSNQYSSATELASKLLKLFSDSKSSILQKL
jgi:hypothetical protein